MKIDVYCVMRQRGKEEERRGKKKEEGEEGEKEIEKGRNVGVYIICTFFIFIIYYICSDDGEMTLMQKVRFFIFYIIYTKTLNKGR